MPGRSTPFLFLGNHVALDFVNTEIVDSTGWVDLFQSDEDLLAWAAAAGLPVQVIPQEVSQHHLEHHARPLRTALRAIFEALIAGRSPPGEAVGVLNAVLARPRPGPALKYQRGTFVATPSPGTTPLDVVQLVAGEAASFLTNLDPDMLRRCARPECVLLFYDASKSHRRRWCSMAICGNRAKVAAHQRRHRDA